MTLADSLTVAAPYYNLVMGLVVIYLFIRLFQDPGKRGYLGPWKWLCVAVLIYIVEEVITALRQLGLVTIQRHINGFFELAIIIIFIYAVLLQKQLIAGVVKPKPAKAKPKARPAKRRGRKR